MSFLQSSGIQGQNMRPTRLKVYLYWCERGHESKRGDFDYKFLFILKAVIWKKNGALKAGSDVKIHIKLSSCQGTHSQMT